MGMKRAELINILIKIKAKLGLMREITRGNGHSGLALFYVLNFSVRR